MGNQTSTIAIKVYQTQLINLLIAHQIDYYEHQRCVIGYRGFTPSFDKIENFNYLKKGTLQNLSLYNFLTGKGGILYKPDFFHKTKNLIFNDKIYIDNCQTSDDIWLYIVRVLNNIKCYIANKSWQTKDIGNDNGLFFSFNKNNNNNTTAFKNSYKK